MKISITEFRARFVEWVDRVDQTGVPIVVTRRGNPVARLAAVGEGGTRESQSGYTVDKAITDIVEPGDNE